MVERLSPTVLPDVNADGVQVGEVGHGGLHGCAGGPHVVEQEHRHGREAEHAQPGHAQDVSQEHKLRPQTHTVNTSLGHNASRGQSQCLTRSNIRHGEHLQLS